ncbi:MAG: L-Ala-D/L-Glu epimerase [Actinomycetota bacterium]|jgi:L-alanine-DL-glutamate epimerase-like enolase superfamily enzyme|nr:L-Ala-D/L-Glu epimerase [Actinomycetota bacterium]
MTLTLETRVMEIPLREPFAISSATWNVAENVFVMIRSGELIGAGEVCTDPRYGDSADSIIGRLEGADLGLLNGPFDLEGITQLLPPGTPRCALDIALHDLAAQAAGISLAELLGLSGRELPATSVTIPIASVEHMQQRALEWADHPIIKMKVGFDGDVDAVRGVRDVFPGTIRIDANEGWDKSTAIEKLNELNRFDIELCEQPIPAGSHDDLRNVTAASPIPIFADEDVNTAQDVVALSGVVDGVNLKLRKTGGIREALRAVNVARAVGLVPMLGCDLETGVGATAQASLAALFDHVDIDGPVAMVEDPFPGVTYDKGRLMLPGGPGLGLQRRPT